MKKSLILVGLLSIGYAHAQQGNVGVNTNAPKATLEVQPTATNLAGTTNEGIIAPKLSKTRVADIAVPVEGTLVYVTNEAESLITAYTGTDVKVAKIDEKGYYYFDGTEWVKAKNVVQDQEWVYDATTNRINLRRSGQAQGFVNKVYYNADTGQFFNKEDETLQINGEEVSFRGDGYYHLLQKKSDKFNSLVTHNGTRNYKTLASYEFNVNEPSVLASLRPTGVANRVRLLESNVSPTFWVPALSNGLEKYDNTISNYLMGVNNSVSVHKGEVSGYVTGGRVEAYINTSGKVGSARGLSSYLSTGVNAQNMGSMVGVLSYAALGSNMTGGGFSEGITLMRSEIDYRTFNPNIPQLIGFHYRGIVNKGARGSNTINHYGILIEDIDKAQNNYALYTKAGQVRFGDLPASTVATDKVVVVDATGVLKTVDRNSIGGTQGIAQEVDGVIGNEVKDVITDRGLVREGKGTEGEPYKVGLISGTKDGDTLVWSQTENKWKVQASQNSASKVIKKFRTVQLPLAEGDWEDDDFTIRITGLSPVFELPNPATNEGRVIALRNGEGTLRTISKHPPLNNTTISGNRGMLLHSDGSNWHVIGGF